MFNNSPKHDLLICLLFVNEKVIDEGVVDVMIVDELVSFCQMSFSLVSFPRLSQRHPKHRLKDLLPI